MNEIAKFPALLKQFQHQIESSLPKHLSGDRMAQVALTAFRKNPALGKCDPRSVFAAVLQSAQLGLELDQLGRAYLIPYGKECQFVPGWRGLVDLCNRTKQATIWTGAVFVGDEFSYELGGAPFCKHKPAGESSPDKLLYVYAIGRIVGSEWPVIECWPVARVLKHRDKYNKVGKRHYSFTNFEMYARKVVLLQVLKYMPSSSDLATAIALTHDADVGVQKIVLEDAIEGVYQTVNNDFNDTPNSKPEIEKPKPKTKPVSRPVSQNTSTMQNENQKPKQDNNGFSYSDIVDMLANAKTQDDVDVAVDVMGNVNQTQRDALMTMANNKAKLLIAKHNVNKNTTSQ